MSLFTSSLDASIIKSLGVLVVLVVEVAVLLGSGGVVVAEGSGGTCASKTQLHYASVPTAEEVH